MCKRLRCKAKLHYGTFERTDPDKAHTENKIALLLLLWEGHSLKLVRAKIWTKPRASWVKNPTKGAWLNKHLCTCKNKHSNTSPVSELTPPPLLSNINPLKYLSTYVLSSDFGHSCKHKEQRCQQMNLHGPTLCSAALLFSLGLVGGRGAWWKNGWFLDRLKVLNLNTHALTS